ncbi:E3 ubiquitin-protein ligase ZNRF2-like isoform X2 [Eleginops maclovinus]|uniref:E3 ubiquitin-protein ligase ZNRF2-like isoform X2 n=1 Tax=Eleginops maclovinus TaxID=56733 RepID=UPI0030807288
MGAKQSNPVFDGRTRAYSSSDLPSGNSSGGGRIAGFRYTNGPDGPRIRYTGGGPTSSGLSIPTGGRSGSHVLNQSLDGPDGDEEGELPPEGHRLLIGSLPAHLSPRLLGGFHCPVCSKFMASDEIEKHLLMCFSKSRLTYNMTAYLITKTLTGIPVFMWAQTDILVPKVKQMVVQDYVTETSDA